MGKGRKMIKRAYDIFKYQNNSISLMISFTLGYYYDEKSSQYKVYEVNERQDIWIRDEFKNESDAINRLYRLIKTKFWIKETPIQLDDSEID